MRYFIFILLFLFGFIAGCKKDELPELPDNNSPVYYVNGTIGEKQISYEAGVEEMYMETDFYDLNNVIQYNANLFSENNYFNISIADANLDIPAYSIEFDTINTLDLAGVNTTPLLQLSKESFNNASQINAVSWNINGVDQMTEYISIDEPGYYSICVNVEFNNGSKRELCNDLILGYEKNTSFGVRHYINQENLLNCFIDIPETEIESISWKVNDAQFITANTLYFELEDQIYLIEADISLKNGVKRTRRIFIDGANQENFIEDFSVMENQNEDYFWDRKARLSLKLGNDIWEPLNYENKIYLSEVVESGVNEEGQVVYKITGTFDGAMMNKNTLEEANGSFEFKLAFAIP